MRAKCADVLSPMSTTTNDSQYVKEFPRHRRVCLCDHCTNVSPRIQGIRDALKGDAKLSHDFNYLVTRLMCAEEDLDVCEAKLAGDWPGWEWMKEARTRIEFEGSFSGQGNAPAQTPTGS